MRNTCKTQLTEQKNRSVFLSGALGSTRSVALLGIWDPEEKQVGVQDGQLPTTYALMSVEAGACSVVSPCRVSSVLQALRLPFESRKSGR